jgi:hypothetical protein
MYAPPSGGEGDRRLGEACSCPQGFTLGCVGAALRALNTQDDKRRPSAHIANHAMYAPPAGPRDLCSRVALGVSSCGASMSEVVLPELQWMVFALVPGKTTCLRSSTNMEEM